MSIQEFEKKGELHFVFRWDAGTKVGNGHFMRCMVLSTELLNRGHKVSVLSRQIPSHLEAMLKDIGLITHYISLESDGLAELSEINLQKKIDWLVIDHYGVEINWEIKARQFATRIMVIDDFAKRPHKADLLLDLNINNKLQKGYDELVPKSCIQAIGWSFLLARPSFYVKNENPRSGTLIFLGGGDHSQVLSSLLHQLRDKTEFHPIRVLVTSDYLPQEYWQSLIGNCGHVYCDLVNPDPLYRSAALALVRCGFISYELALLGTPTINIHKSPIQAEVALELERKVMGVAFPESLLSKYELLHFALQKASSISPTPLNEILSPGAPQVAKLLEQINEHQ